MIEPHASGSLHYGFKDDSCKIFLILLKQFPHWTEIFRIPFLSKAALRSRSKMSYRQCRTERTVHSGDRIAHGHGVPRITVVSGTDGCEIGFLWVVTSLHCHLHCHLSRNRAGISIKYMLHGWRKNREQEFAEIDCRLMGETAEHHVRHLFDLIVCSLVEHRMVITVYHTPPR